MRRGTPKSPSPRDAPSNRGVSTWCPAGGGLHSSRSIDDALNGSLVLDQTLPVVIEFARNTARTGLCSPQPSETGVSATAQAGFLNVCLPHSLSPLVLAS